MGLVPLVVVVGLACLVLLAVPMTLLRMRSGDHWRHAAWRSGLDAAIIASLAGIGLLTLQSYFVGGEGQVNLLPFRSLIDNIPLGDFWIRLAMFDLAGNFLLYFPLGLLVTLRFPALSLARWALVALGLSGIVELIQWLWLSRSADITDIITNGAGAVAGYLVGRLLQRLALHASRVRA